MSLFTPPPEHDTESHSQSPPQAHRGFDHFMAQQRDWWRQWLEAGNLWTSWWLSQIPPLGWPPGQVAPPPEASVGTDGDMAASSAEAQEAAALPTQPLPGPATPPRARPRKPQ